MYELLAHYVLSTFALCGSDKQATLVKPRLKLRYRLRKNETSYIFLHFGNTRKTQRTNLEGGGVGSQKKEGHRRMDWFNLAGCPERAIDLLLVSDPPRPLERSR